MGGVSSIFLPLEFHPPVLHFHVSKVWNIADALPNAWRGRYKRAIFCEMSKFFKVLECLDDMLKSILHVNRIQEGYGLKTTDFSTL